MNGSGRVVLLLAGLLTLGAPAVAQTIADPAAHLASSVAGRARQIAALRQKAAQGALGPAETAQATISLSSDIDRIYLALLPQVSRRALQELEERRADKQLGEASSSTAGSTSLVARGGTPAILALAVENGALVQDVSGTTVTVRGTPAGVARALAGRGYFDTLATDDPAIAILQRFSFSASFDTSRGIPEGQPAAFTADRGQFSAASLRFVAVDHKDPRAAVNDARWAGFAFTQMDLDEAALDAFVSLRQDPAIVAWLSTAQQEIALAPPDRIEGVVVDQFRALAGVDIAPATRAAVERAGRQFEGLLDGRAEVLRDIAGGSQLVFDWAYQRPAAGLESSNLRLVGSVGRSVLLTGNGSVTLYHGTLPIDTERVRDIQAAVQLDIPMGDPDALGRYVVSFSTKVQHMPDDVVLGDGVLFPGTQGTIWLGQVKLTIPVRGSAARIPVSITVANRTELNPERTVFARANIGFSYDLDAVFARFKP